MHPHTMVEWVLLTLVTFYLVLGLLKLTRAVSEGRDDGDNWTGQSHNPRQRDNPPPPKPGVRRVAPRV